MKLSKKEIRQLQEVFRDLDNWQSENPLDPIDPLAYRDPEGDNCLHIASRRGYYEAVVLLLRAGFDVNATGDMRYTALHYAYQKGHQNIADLLIQNGASDEIISEFGTKPSAE